MSKPFKEKVNKELFEKLCACFISWVQNPTEKQSEKLQTAISDFRIDIKQS